MPSASPTQRDLVLQAIQARPSDPWPRGFGHVVLGVPGSPRSQKAYHEPGGSFSPAPGSLGISLWVLDANGVVVATSDSIPLARIDQRYEWETSLPAPALPTRTPYYTCRWRRPADDRWEAELEPRQSARLAVAIRSVGPAGGPVNALWWDGVRLVVNHRWVVWVEGAETEAFLDDEERAGWMTSRSQDRSLQSAAGWGRRALS